jgi:putative ABC transport system permease protein
MFKNYLITAWRNILKNRTFSLINVLGLALGMAVFMIILVYTSFELSYDDYHDNKDHLYRWNMVTTTSNSIFDFARASPPLGNLMKKEIPEIKEVGRLMPCPENSNYITISYIDEKEDITSFHEEHAFYADASMLRMFDFLLLAGDTFALENPYTVIISASTAERYFGKVSDELLGETLHIPYLGEDNAQYKLTGIFQDLPLNSHLQADILMSYSTLTEHDPHIYEDYWHHLRTYVYAQTYPHVTETQFLQKREAYNKLVNEKYQAEYWAPDSLVIDCKILRVDNIYLHSANTDEIKPTGNALSVYLLTIVGFLTVIIAIVNYVNLTTAKSVQRGREIGVRKVAGASRRQLMLQFFSETFVLNLLAVLITLLILWLSFPYFQQLIGKPLSFHIWWEGMPDTGLFFSVIGLLFLFGTLISGIYPAVVLSSFRPLKTLKGNLMVASGKGVGLRSTLVIVQFTISILLIAGTLLIYLQLKYMQSQSLGFDKEQMLVIRAPTDSIMKTQVLETFKEELISHSFVKNATASSIVPGHHISWIAAAGLTKDTRITNQMFSVDHEFMDTYDFAFNSGRNFAEDHPSDRDAIIINETYAKKLGFQDPKDALHKILWTWAGDKEVIGIVKDHHQASLKESFSSICFILEGENPALDRAYLSVKVITDQLEENIAFIQDLYQSRFPGYPFAYFFLDEQYNQQYKTDIQFGRIFGIFTGLAIFIACLGILGLSSFLAVQKRKEIGIRKVHGASVAHIVIMFIGKYVRLILIALLIGLPVANYIFDTWLENYAFRIKIGWEFFVVPSFLLLIITLATISYQTIKAARANPVNTLKYE